MNRRFFVIGDIEMGKGDLMDDFHDDEGLVRFVEYVGSFASRGVGAHAGPLADEVALILNGDIFDFLKMDYEGKYPRYITEEISMWKLERVLETHPKVFAAWRKFLENERTKLVFVIGNHDPDLVWPEVQKRLREVLGAGDSQKIVFTHFFDEAHFHVQHGNLIDPLFGFDYKKPIIEHKGRKILNLPAGWQIASQYLTPFKKKFHKQEVLYPQQEVFKKYPEYKKEMNRMMRRYGLKIFLIDPLLHFLDPMFQVPYLRVLKHLLKHGFDGVHDDRFLDVEELEGKFGKKEVYVLAHAHVLADRHDKKARYIFIDCWRTELDVRTEDLKKKPKTYVEIALEDDKMVAADLKEFEI